MKRLGWALVASLAISCGGSTIDVVVPFDAGRDAKFEKPDAGSAGKPGAEAGTKPDAGGHDDASFPEASRDVAIDPPIPDATTDRSADVIVDRPGDVVLEPPADVAIDRAGDGGCAIDCASLPNVRPGAPVECRNGQCYIPALSCVQGFGHCSNRPEDGCEADFSSITSCGRCGKFCYGVDRCVLTDFGYVCQPDCFAPKPDPCFSQCVDTSSDVLNCGTCGHACKNEAPNATVSCDHGHCKIDSCNEGFGDCTSEPGCESRLDTADNCGVCGRKVCTFANATSPCVTTGCGEPVCNSGFANCDKSNLDCETPIASAAATCWPHYLGTVPIGGAPGQPASVALLADGSHFVGGDFGRAADFDPGPGLDLHTPVAPPDAFVAKFTVDGALVWAKTFGGDLDDAVTAIAAGPDGSVVAVGHYGGTVDFDPGPGVDSHTVAGGDREPFVLKLAADGSFVWVRTFPAIDFASSDAHAVVVASDGSVFVAGDFSGGIDLDPGTGVLEAHANGNAFIVKLTSAGSFVWGRALGGLDCDSNTPSSLALASDGVLWAAGRMYGRCPLDTTDPDQPSDTDPRTFVASFSATGDYRLSWRFPYANGPASVAVASDDSIYVGSDFTGRVDFDPGPSATERTPPPDAQGQTGVAGYVAKYGKDGTFRWVMMVQNLLVTSIAVGGDRVLAVGSPYAVETGTNGMGLTGIDTPGVSLFSATIGGTQTWPGAVTAAGARFVVVGQTDGLADFDPGPGVDVIDRGAVHFASRYSF
jgi:hypothetical protein